MGDVISINTYNKSKVVISEFWEGLFPKFWEIGRGELNDFLLFLGMGQ